MFAAVLIELRTRELSERVRSDSKLNTGQELESEFFVAAHLHLTYQRHKNKKKAVAVASESPGTESCPFVP